MSSLTFPLLCVADQQKENQCTHLELKLVNSGQLIINCRHVFICRCGCIIVFILHQLHLLLEIMHALYMCVCVCVHVCVCMCVYNVMCVYACVCVYNCLLYTSDAADE